MKRFGPLLVVIAAVSLACAVQQRDTAEQARAIEGQVWSPYCPGRLLIDCTTQQARELRDEIEQRLGDGQSTDEVLRWIRLNYGDEALAAPSPKNALLIWSFPIAVLVVGGAILAVLIRRWATKRKASEHAGT